VNTRNFFGEIVGGTSSAKKHQRGVVKSQSLPIGNAGFILGSSSKKNLEGGGKKGRAMQTTKRGHISKSKKTKEREI